MDQAIQTLALIVTGLVGVPTCQLIKRWLKLSGSPMAWVAYLVSLALALITLALTGKPVAQYVSHPLNLLQDGSIVFAVAYLIYRTIAEKMGLSGDLLKGGGQ